MLKVKPHSQYPPEEGRYIRGNDFSPAIVVIVLNRDEDKIPPEIEQLVRVGIESGAALSGTVQTENIGFEKIICNVVANPNIRYAILSGPESPGHQTGEAFKALLINGVDEEKRIVGTNAPHPLLYNLPFEYIVRFRKQIELIDLQFKGTPETIRKAVWSCFQENPVDFVGYRVHDPGAYPEAPLSGRITDRVTQPWNLPKDKKEMEAVKRMQEFVEKMRKKQKKGGNESE
jgi:tetrahydromethanopterin S-methyltransferase subunit A